MPSAELPRMSTMLSSPTSIATALSSVGNINRHHNHHYQQQQQKQHHQHNLFPNPRPSSPLLTSLDDDDYGTSKQDSVSIVMDGNSNSNRKRKRELKQSEKRADSTGSAGTEPQQQQRQQQQPKRRRTVPHTNSIVVPPPPPKTTTAVIACCLSEVKEDGCNNNNCCMINNWKFIRPVFDIVSSSSSSSSFGQHYQKSQRIQFRKNGMDSLESNLYEDIANLIDDFSYY